MSGFTSLISTNSARIASSRTSIFAVRAWAKLGLAILALMLTNVLISLAANAQEEGTISIYSIHSQSPIGEVAATAKYRVLADIKAEASGKKRIRFSQPVVKGWVSEQYLTINELTNTATVVADVLNFRVGPTVTAQKMAQVYQGHESLLLNRRSGFAQIYAPTSLEVLIDASNAQPQTAIAESESTGDSNLVRSVTSSEPAIRVTPTENTARVDTDPADDSEWAVGTSRSNNNEPATETDRLGADTGFDGLESLDSPDSEPVRDNEPLSNVDAVNPSESKHLLAPGDSISLLVFGEPDLSAQNVRVPQSGRVSFPLIGSITVLGKTTSDVEKDVAALLSQGYVRNPRLSISIFSYRPIFIRGEVGSTGDFPFSEGLTIAKAIAIAGGTKDSAKSDGVSITRDGKIVAENLSVNSQVLVASGDIVSVDADAEVKEAESSYVYLHGEVVQTGAYEFRQGLTVEKAIVLAGGFTLRASRKKISISRYADASEDGAPSELKRVKLYTPIKPGDVIKVGASWF